MAGSSNEAPLHIIVLAHPEQDSFNASVAAAYGAAVQEKGHRALVRDLYAMGFDPVLQSAERPGAGMQASRDVEDELAIIRDAAVFVLVYPIWFGTPPAMMKGYVERVLGSGVTPDAVQGGAAAGVLTGKRMLSFTTSATKALWLDEQGQLNALKQSFDWYIEHAFAMKPPRHFHFGHVVTGMPEHWVAQNLQQVREHAHAAVADLEREVGAGDSSGRASPQHA